MLNETQTSIQSTCTCAAQFQFHFYYPNGYMALIFVYVCCLILLDINTITCNRVTDLLYKQRQTNKQTSSFYYQYLYAYIYLTTIITLFGQFITPGLNDYFCIYA